jgi:recombination protein RecT
MTTAIQQTGAKRDIRSLLQSESVKQQLALVLPKHITPDRMARVACTAAMRNPKLLTCTPESLLNALMICSQAGLEPDGRQAHLIPFENRKTGCVEVQVIFDYKGLIQLARRNGVKNIAGDVICEADVFEWSRGMGGLQFKHQVEWRKPRGPVFGAYVIWQDGDQFDGEVMTKDEIESIRARSKSPNAGPWQTDWNEMAKKTVVRRASKRWPLDSEAAAAIGDEEESVTVDVKPSAAMPQLPATTADADEIPMQPATPEVAPQEQLAAFVVDECRFTFDDLRKWGERTGNIKGASDLTAFQDIPTKEALRLLRAKDGLRTQLAAMKGEQS